MRNLLTPMAITLALTLAGSGAASAQDTQVRVQNRIQHRIPEIVEDVHRLIDKIVGHEITQEIGRGLQGIGRELDRARVAATGAMQSRDFKAEQIDRQTKTVAIGPTGELELRNIVGDITVKGGGGREATVEIVRTSRGRTDADAKLGLERVTVEVLTSGDRGSVRTQYPNDVRPAYGVTVAYTVTMPAGARLSVDTVTGAVRVSGIRGEMSVKTISGLADVSSCERVAMVQTVSGDITLRNVQSTATLDVGSVSSTITIDNAKARRIEVNVVSGRISARGVQAAGASIGAMSGDLEYSGAAAPQGRYEFKAHSGNLRIALTGGFDLEARTFSGTVEADQSLGIQTSGSSRRSLRGTTGDGGAAVVATTFSGNVWVGRAR